MEKRTFVYGEDCSKCHMLKPFAEKTASMRGIEMISIVHNELNDESIITIPTLIVDNGETKTYKTDEDLVNYIRP